MIFGFNLFGVLTVTKSGIKAPEPPTAAAIVRKTKYINNNPFRLYAVSRWCMSVVFQRYIIRFFCQFMQMADALSQRLDKPMTYACGPLAQLFFNKICAFLLEIDY